MLFGVPVTFWCLRSLAFQQPFSLFGVDFVILFWDYCLAAMPFDRGLELCIHDKCGFFWSCLTSVLQPLLGSFSILKVYPGYYNDDLCNINVSYFLPLSSIMQLVSEFGEIGAPFPQPLQLFPIWMHLMGCGYSCDAIVVFCVGWCWAVMVFQGMYVFSLPYARPQILFFSTTPLPSLFNFFWSLCMWVIYSIKGEVFFVVSPFFFFWLRSVIGALPCLCFFFG